jgi:outer membrane protein assembly factor BamB
MDMSGIKAAQPFRVGTHSASSTRFSMGDRALAQVTTADFCAPGGDAPLQVVDREKAKDMIFAEQPQQSDRVKWDFNANVPLHGISYNPVIGPDGTIYAEYDLTGLIALDGTTGEKKWSVRSRIYEAGPLMTPGNTLVAWGGKREGDYALSGFDPKDGSEKWRIASHEYGIAGLVQGPGGLIVAGRLRPGELVGLDGDTGQEKWSQTGYREMPVMSQNDGGTLYLPEDSERIHVLDGKTGKKKFAIHVKKKYNESFSHIKCSPGGDVAAYRADGRLLVFDGQTGKKKWDLAAEKQGPTNPWSGDHAPAITWGPDGTFFLCTDTKKFCALDGDTGAQKWVQKGEIDAREIVVGTNGDVFAIDRGHRLVALDGTTGKVKWEFITKENVSTITLAPDGTLILTEEKGTIHSIATLVWQERAR